MRILLPLLFVLILNIGYGQAGNAVFIGSKDSLYSSVLKEQRDLLISLPLNYSPKNKYPIAYLIDGEEHFIFFTGMVTVLGKSSLVPEMIVVGIVNTNRNKDLTPTYDPQNFDSSNGGGEQFTRFLESELIPYVESHYASAPYRMLVGHSLGGLFVINTLVHHPALFDSYIAIDPSLWWDHMKLVQQSSVQLSQNKFKGKNLFMAVAGPEPVGVERARIKKDTTPANAATRAVVRFDDLLVNSAQPGLRSSSKYYKDETHGSIPLMGALDGLKFTFDFYRRPSFAVLTDSTATVLETHYKKVSEKMGYSILPPEYDLAGLAWRSRVMENNFHRALLFLQLYLKLYPQSAGAYESMAEYYEARGDTEKAKAFYEKAKALSEEPSR